MNAEGLRSQRDWSGNEEGAEVIRALVSTRALRGQECPRSTKTENVLHNTLLSQRVFYFFQPVGAL